MNTLKNYYAALKPERTYANVMTTAAGFLFACQWHVRFGLLLATLVGTTAVVMSACAVNNVTDRDLDARMPRTKKRATATGLVPRRNLAVLAVLLGASGFVILALWVNWLTVAVGAIAYLDYVVFYAWSKRTTPWSTLIGTISGAAPLVAGYTAVTGRFGLTALALGLVMLFWQMPHFYSIGVFRLKDYRAGGLPIWPVCYGVTSTQHWILVYTVLYLASLGMLSIVGSTGPFFVVITAGLGLYWLFRGAKGLQTVQPEKWARSMFGFSLITLLVLSAAISLSPLLS